MKIAASLVLASAGAASAAKKAVDLTASRKVSGSSARKLIRASRKLEENDQDQQEEDEFYFLTNYRMKFVQCLAGEQVQGDDGYESSAVIFRLCASGAESTSAFGCTDAESYGDYVVGINTYTQAIAENMREEAEANGQEDDGDFDLGDYAQCAEADMDMDNGRKLDEEEWNQYFIGPKCVNVMDSKGKKVVGTDIAFGFFSDEYCTTESTTSYYEFTGQAIPYSSGGLGGQYTSCANYNDDGELEAKDMCTQLIENPAYSCDAANQGGCEKIEALEAELKASEAKGNGGKIFLIILIIAAALGGAFWFLKKKKEKDAANGEPTTGGFFSQLC